MMVAAVLIALGVALRQVDRWWFSDYRRSGLIRLTGRARSESIHEVMARQRQRRNDVTPVLLLIGHWVEIAGWWRFAGLGVGAAALAGLAVAVKLRHLQEVSHYGIHFALCRSRRLGDVLVAALVHGPMALGSVESRRDSHVRQHHPNAAVPGADPNLTELARAGLKRDCGRAQFLVAVLRPLTLAGIGETCARLGRNAVAAWWRPPLLVAVVSVAYSLGGWWAVLLAVVLPRVAIYPQFAWLSLLVEHQWLRTDLRAGRPREVEAQRCLRLYPRQPLLASLARGTWLPYGDLFHFAHSVYPGVRWNYLPVVDRLLGPPSLAPDRLLLGRSAALATLYASTRQLVRQ